MVTCCLLAQVKTAQKSLANMGEALAVGMNSRLPVHGIGSACLQMSVPWDQLLGRVFSRMGEALRSRGTRSKVYPKAVILFSECLEMLVCSL